MAVSLALAAGGHAQSIVYEDLGFPEVAGSLQLQVTSSGTLHASAGGPPSYIYNDATGWNPTPGVSEMNFAQRINAANQFFGFSMMPDGSWQTYMWDPVAGAQVYGDAYSSFNLEGLDDGGNYWGTRRGYVGWDVHDTAVIGRLPGGMVDLDTSSFNTTALRREASGLVYGTLELDYSHHRFVRWSAPGVMEDLLQGRFTFSRRPLISGKGAAVQTGTETATGQTGIVVWDPVQGPRMALVTSGQWNLMGVNGPGTVVFGEGPSGRALVDLVSGTVVAGATGYSSISDLSSEVDAAFTETTTGQISMFLWEPPAARRYLPAGFIPLGTDGAGVLVGEVPSAVDGTPHAAMWSASGGLVELSIGDSGRAVAKVGEQVFGTFYDTNHIARVFRATLPPPAPKDPDLEVTGLTVTPDPRPSSQVGRGNGRGDDRDCDDDRKKAKTATVKVTVRNRGDGPAAASTTRLAEGRSTLATWTTPALEAGQSVELTWSWNLKRVQEGRHTLTVTADSASIVAETNETNNVLRTTYTVRD